MLRMKRSSLGLGNSTKHTRKREFLTEMERVVPWAALVELVAPFTPKVETRPPLTVIWHVAMRPGKRAGQDKTRRSHELIDELERLKASIHAKVEHPSRVITRQFKHVKVRYRGLKKNTAQLSLLVALSNLWRLRTTLQVLDGQIRAQPAKAAGEMA